ncbi:hypothetical protein [Sphingobium sp. CECT 9361]|nr:hypothetical protein [Sphingobium sp. CECT 9361]CAH0356911.1 hypothetical protein SPH9361_04557 [Sphingobium sp. CECT 9361]
MRNISKMANVVLNAIVIIALAPLAILASPVFVALDAYDRAHGIELEY